MLRVVESVCNEVRGVDTDRKLPLDVTEDADLDGPSFDATRADLSMKRLNSYFDRIYCSSSLSLSASIKFGGGGCRTSFGLYIALERAFPVAFMCSTCSFVHESIVKLLTFVT